MNQPALLLSGFADEAAIDKTLDQQFSALAALGMCYFSIRFLDAGNGIKNIMDVSDVELETIQQKIADYGLNVSSLGSPIGKVKLEDTDDGTKTPYRPFEEYIQNEVPRACDLTNRLGAKLIRGFSFYHPRGSKLEDYRVQATDQVGKIAEVCRQHGLIFGLEVEANLVGQNGTVLAQMHREIANDALVLIFDGGNIVMQGYSTDEVYQQYLEMKPGLGWIHIKDFCVPENTPRSADGHVNEDAVKNFVPADLGDSGHDRIMADLADYLPEVHERMTALGAEGVFADMEPHVKGGGQFGGFSGPDGFGVALRAFCRVCEQAGVGYRLRDFSDIQTDRGF